MSSVLKPVMDAVLYSSTPRKAVVLTAIVLVGSFLCSTEQSPSSSFLENKENPLNQYYVKFVWGWTLLCLVPMVTLTVSMYTSLDLFTTFSHLIRLVVDHAIWYTTTRFFTWYREQVGRCSDDTITDQMLCLKQGHSWWEIDLSGHTFLLSFCVLVLSEESVALNTVLNQASSPSSPSVTDSSHSKSKKSFLRCCRPFAVAVCRLLEAVALLLMLLDVFMLTSTSLYFHTFVEKVVALLVALVWWIVTYRVAYGQFGWLPVPIRGTTVTSNLQMKN